MVVVSSHGHVCHRTKITKGVDPFSAEVTYQSKEIVNFIAGKGFYTITIESTDDCYYTIRVIPTRNGITELR